MKIGVMIIGFLGLYLVAMLVIGIRSQKYATTFQTSIFAGGETTVLLLIGSAVGSHIGSGFVVGGAEYGVLYGLGGAWYGLGCGLSYICVGLLMVRFIYRNRYVSLSDYFSERYHHPLIQIIYTVSTILGCIAMFAGQLLAGKSVFLLAGINGTYGLIITAFVSLVYATFSGLWGVMATAVLQSVVIFISIAASLVVLIQNNGISVLQERLPVSYFEIIPFDSETLVMLIVPTILSCLIAQPLMQRIVSAKNERTAAISLLTSGFLLFPIAFVPVLIGMYGRSFYPELAYDQIFSQVAVNNLPMVLAALLLSSIICAVISSCNAAFIAASTGVTRDLFQNILYPDISDLECKILSGVVNLVVCAVGVLLAVQMSDIIELLSLSYTFLIAGSLIPFLGGVIWKKGTANGAIASAVIGIGCVVLNSIGVISFPYASISPLLPALVGYIAVSLLERKRQTNSFR